MRIAVLGTGFVGRALAARLNELGHGVFMGTRDVEATMDRSNPDTLGNPPFRDWIRDHPAIKLATLADSAADSEWVVNATNGAASIEALERVGDQHLTGKVLVDVANPLAFSEGMPTLVISNTDSLGEAIQRRFPETQVVETLNTMNAQVMVDPRRVGGGNHTVFVCGNSEAAKSRVSDLLKSFGWSDIVDLGDITAARGTEMYLPLWLRVMYAGTGPLFNVKVVTSSESS